MIVLPPRVVQRIFDKWRLPLLFQESELDEANTPKIVDEPAERILGFRTPAANDTLHILNLRQLLGVDPKRQPSFFDHPWYLDELFARENCPPGWHFIDMDVVPESVARPFDYYNSLYARGLVLPNAIEVVLMLFLYYEHTGEQLLLKKHTWCSDEASLGRRVTVGAFGRNGLFISSHPPGFASRGLGICGKLARRA